VPAKYRAAGLADFLFQPHRVRPSGRMPDMKLTPTEAAAVAGYLLGPAAAQPAAFRPDEKLAALGKRHFERLNCASCHKLGDVPAAKPVGPLAGADLSKGCVWNKPGPGPRYTLDDGQMKAIRAALAVKPEPVSDHARIAATLTAFNCIGCHKRDKFGGVSEDTDPYFTSSEKELGDDGRIPPPLTLVGAKLQKVTLKKVLFDGDGVRPYMATRMPQYGEPNLRHLPDLLAKVDAVKPVEFKLPGVVAAGEAGKDRDREKVMRAAGRDLVGDKGLGCVACHTFNGKAAGKHGIELLTTTERLRPEWFYHFMQNPSAFRPGVVMPTSWPNGKAMQTEILAGDTHRQLEAIWYYLSLGTSAQPPSGVQNPETLLTVTDGARTYRGRSSVAGFRGIAVGFPEKLNYAFNAETGTMSAVWKGDFVRVNRGGQGSGNFNPAGRFVPLHQDVSFCELDGPKAAWPLRPVMTKESPVNPNPLYPKNLGYQFKGYHTDDASVPTFMYTFGVTAIEDRSAVRVVEQKPTLVRTLAFDSPTARTLWFRVLTGRLEAETQTRFKTPEMRVTVPDLPSAVRPTADGKSSELILKFDIPQGKSTKALTYELLP
jgi:mono/diheme cytochrome c family protein